MQAYYIKSFQFQINNIFWSKIPKKSIIFYTNYGILIKVIKMIVKELFANLAILVTLLFIYSQLTKKSPLNHHSSIPKKLTVGILGGLLGNILMQYSMHIENIIVDLRLIPVILLAFYGGTIPAFVSMTFIILGRFLFGMNASSLVAASISFLVTIGVVLLVRSNVSKHTKMILCLTWNNLVFSFVISFFIKKGDFIPVYWIISYLGGMIAFYMINYLRSIHLLFEKYKKESTLDGLTGLNNYRKFDDIFNTLIKKLDERQEQLSLLYIDIDHFKKINDQYGHSNGDQVLKQVGEILRNSTRSFDIVSRNGGEEFTVLLLDCPLNKAYEIAERIRMNVEAYPFHLSEKTIHITVSIGVSCYRETTLEAEQIIEDADKALYFAKNNGRNKVCVANAVL